MPRSLRAVVALLALTVAGCAQAKPPGTADDEPWRNPYIQTPRFEDLRPSETFSLLPLKHTYLQVDEHTCGPSATMMVAAYFNAKESRPLDRVRESKIAEEMGSSEDKGTSPKQLHDWLTQHGFDATLGGPGDLQALRDNLKAGVPTLVEWIDWGGHWAVVIGYDTLDTKRTDDDVIILADPADYGDDKRDGITYFNAGRFDAMWFDAQYFQKGTIVKRVMIPVKGWHPVP